MRGPSNGHHVGHGAAGADLGQQHGLVRGEDGGAFGHEMDAAEHDHIMIGLCRGAGKFERIAGDVGDVLDLGPLIIVGQDDGVQVFFELQDLFAEGLMSYFQYS